MTKKDPNLFLDAAGCCMDIFNDYDSEEIEDFAESIQHAWHVGRKLVEQVKESK